LIVAVILGLILGLVIGTGSLIALYAYRRRSVTLYTLYVGLSNESSNTDIVYTVGLLGSKVLELVSEKALIATTALVISISDFC